MLARLISLHALASLLAVVAAPAALAQSAADRPTAAAPGTLAPAAAIESQDQCLAAATELAELAEKRQLSEQRRDQLEELLVRMESLCDARQFPEATAVVRDIRRMIEAN